MIKYLMRKTILKEADPETQDMFLRLIYRRHIIEILCWMMWAVIFISPMIPLVIIDLCEDVEFALSTQLLVVAFMIVWLLGFIFIMKFFGVALLVCTHLISEKIYFWVCTIKGRALSRKDFETIKNKNNKLYEFVSSSNCRGYCYSICFEMLKVLKKGCIEFIAVKKFSTQKDDEDDDGRDFTMHVLYVNNGWAFDTYSQRQYPIEELHQIYKAITYRSFNYDEIENKSYDDFKSENEPQLAEWCNSNDCSQFWKEKVS